MKTVFMRNLKQGERGTMSILLVDDDGVDVDMFHTSVERIAIDGDLSWFAQPFFESLKGSLVKPPCERCGSTDWNHPMTWPPNHARMIEKYGMRVEICNECSFVKYPKEKRGEI